MINQALYFNQVTKNYGLKCALKNISLHIEPGEKVALLGCNGAGKSTLINLATGLRKQTSGEIKVLGELATKSTTQEKLAYLPQVLKFPSYLKVKEVINVVERHFNTQLDPNLLHRLELTSLLGRYCSGLSGGEERKLGLALALVGQRPLLILDEPTANVDLVAKFEIHKILMENVLSQKQAFLFSSHEMDEVEKLADRVIVLNKGQIVADGDVAQIKRSFGSMTVHFSSLSKEIFLESSTKIELKGHTPDQIYNFKVYGLNSDTIIKELVERKIEFQNLSVEQTSLDEVFLKLWSQRT
jgi:ABC-2 type transport system ATP-binding protein